MTERELIIIVKYFYMKYHLLITIIAHSMIILIIYVIIYSITGDIVNSVMVMLTVEISVAFFTHDVNNI